ncbi:MAG: Smr/MutS family protein [Pseudomonadota bacterium]
MKRRGLSPEDVDLWKKVADQTEPLHRRETFDPAAFAPKPLPKPMARPIPLLLDGKSPPKPPPRKTTVDLAPTLPDRIAKAPVQMDRKTFAKMARGKLKPEARIDLHGMTLDRAHSALTRFILTAHGSGKRLVLVITGKGKDRDEGGPIPTRFGVLKHQAPQWLAMPPLSSVVLQISQAHISHGGGGAYYVYLKRRR